jgi:signal transduction histidine kinase
MRIHRFLCLVLACLLYCQQVQAQQLYTAADSARIYQWLDHADAADLKGDMQEAAQWVEKALVQSRQLGMRRGEGFALLKKADLQAKLKGKEVDTLLFAKSRQLGVALQDSLLTGLAYHQQGQYLLQTNRYPEARQSLETANLYYQSDGLLYYRGLVLNEMGFIQDRLGNREIAMEYFLQAVRVFEAVGEKKEAANSLGNMALILYRQGQVAKAIDIFKECAAIRLQLGDVKGAATTYTNLSVAYTNLHIDSAVHYQQKAIPLVEKSGTLANKAQAYASLGVLLTRQKKAGEAIHWHSQAIELYRQMGDSIKIAYQYAHLAETLVQQDDLKSALQYLQQAEAIGKTLESKNLLQHIYLTRSKVLEEAKMYSDALAAYRQYEKYKDTLLNEKSTAQINELQIKYETEKKDIAIQQLQAEQQIKQLELEKQKALLLGEQLKAAQKEIQMQLLQKEHALGLLQVEEKQRALQAQELLNKNQAQALQISQQELAITEAKQQMAERRWLQERSYRNALAIGTVLLVVIGVLLFNRYKLRKQLLEQQRLMAMRNNISKDLHDEVGSTLASIQILSGVSERAVANNPAKAQELLQTITKQSRQVQQTMSDIVWAIRPDNDTVGDLMARIREYIGQTLEPAGISTQVLADDALQSQVLPLAMRKDALLICKEALHNIVKHAGATSVVVKLYLDKEKLAIDIADNGTWQLKPQATGTGLHSMQERAYRLGGTLQIVQQAGGTTVSLHLPIP